MLTPLDGIQGGGVRRGNAPEVRVAALAAHLANPPDRTEGVTRRKEGRGGGGRTPRVTKVKAKLMYVGHDVGLCFLFTLRVLHVCDAPPNCTARTVNAVYMRRVQRDQARATSEDILHVTVCTKCTACAAVWFAVLPSFPCA